MIRASNGEIEVNGELTEITSDVAGILHAYRAAVAQNFDEDTANRLFAIVGRMAALPKPSEANKEELELFEQYAEDFAEIVHEGAERKRGRR